MSDPIFYKNKIVLITGHTGFKGSWLCHILANAGAVVHGYSLRPPTSPALFELCGLEQRIHSETGDIRDYGHLRKVFQDVKPEIVFHLAAQPLVRESYRIPRETYETNIMGTVNILECARLSTSVRSMLNVTTDKVYENREWQWGYRENEPLDGFDPYSNSKSCSDIATHCYANSFLSKQGVAVSCARAGNVIGGGDFAKDRIVPDCIRAAIAGTDIIVRNPHSIRPYQHVLESMHAYLLIAARQYKDAALAGCYNVGPDDRDCFETGELADIFCKAWGEGAKWLDKSDGGPHEAGFLKLDCAKLKSTFGWKPRWNLATAIQNTVEWTKCWRDRGDVVACMDRQIENFYRKEL